MAEAEDDGPVRVPITGVLDLHTFRPAEIGDLVPEYLIACRERGIPRVRIIHGKGTGTLRETVHAILRRSPLVANFGLADETGGGWGATVAELVRPDQPPVGSPPCIAPPGGSRGSGRRSDPHFGYRSPTRRNRRRPPRRLDPGDRIALRFRRAA